MLKLWLLLQQSKIPEMNEIFGRRYSNDQTENSPVNEAGCFHFPDSKHSQSFK
jgi:hypothetical protein